MGKDIHHIHISQRAYIHNTYILEPLQLNKKTSQGKKMSKRLSHAFHKEEVLTAATAMTRCSNQTAERSHCTPIPAAKNQKANHPNWCWDWETAGKPCSLLVGMQKAVWKIVSVKALVNSTPRAYPADSRTCGHKSHEILMGAVKVDQLQLYWKMCASHLKLSARSQTEDYIPYDSMSVRFKTTQNLSMLM